MQKTKKLSKSKIKNLLLLFKYVISQKSGNKLACLRYLDDNSIDSISESIYNLLFNEKLNLVLSSLQKRKLKKIIKPNIQNFEIISKKKIPIRKRRSKIIQQGSGIATILLTLLPMLSSLLIKK